jgi:nitroimidazol reductase NimA-like FMN-containing flavoprotein (pyridoxamine 5'-phosphate oxidase superfamily)
MPNRSERRNMQTTRNSLPDRKRKGDIAVRERLIVIDKEQLHAVLATDMDGQPYASMVAYALVPNSSAIVFVTPNQTLKYRNILRNGRVALLIDTRSNTGKDYMKAESLTILGHARPVRKGKTHDLLSHTLTKKHAKLSKIMRSPRTRLILVTIHRCIHVSQFQTVSEWTPGDRP